MSRNNKAGHLIPLFERFGYKSIFLTPAERGIDYCCTNDCGWQQAKALTTIEICGNDIVILLSFTIEGALYDRTIYLWRNRNWIYINDDTMGGKKEFGLRAMLKMVTDNSKNLTLEIYLDKFGRVVSIA